MRWAYYNEIDEKKCAWLRELIKRGVITDGEVDQRSIDLVQPDDLRGYRRVHMFAGIGVWDYALNLAEWGANQTWTGSCPCQPFSAAGQRQGKADRRHLWPAWFRLLRECRPRTVFAEQVASADGLAWLDDVLDDLEGAGYAVGALDLCSAGFGSPNIRQRLFIVAQSHCGNGRAVPCGMEGQDGLVQGQSASNGGAPGLVAHAAQRRERDDETEPRHGGYVRASGNAGLVAHAGGERVRAAGPGCADGAEGAVQGGVRERERLRADAGQCGATGLVAHDDDEGLDRREAARLHGGNHAPRHDADGRGDAGELGDTDAAGPQGCIVGHRAHQPPAGPGGVPGPVNGFWADAEWIWCRDEKWRAVEPVPERMAPGLASHLGSVRVGGASFFHPLQTGSKARIMRLKGYGDCINAEVAKEFIRAYMSI